MAFESIVVSLIGQLAVTAVGASDPASLGMEPLIVTPAETVESFERGSALEVLGCYVGENVGSDEQRAEDVAAAFAKTEGEALHLLALGIERARSLLDSPIFVARIERLATLLEERGTLGDLDALHEILRTEYA